jgi:hypothetical protein
MYHRPTAQSSMPRRASCRLGHARPFLTRELKVNKILVIQLWPTKLNGPRDIKYRFSEIASDGTWKISRREIALEAAF